MALKDKVLHQWLPIPYLLHTTISRSSPSRKATATLLFLHGIGSSEEAWHDVITRLPANYRIITIDLLGFGKSPKPTWNTYDARRQARAIIITYLRLRIRGKVTVIGHSLGALVAVEMAKRYPRIIGSLILCSPPFYNTNQRKQLLPNSDILLRNMYRLARTHPAQFVKLSALAVKLGLTNKSYSLTKDNVAIYMDVLEATIINQTSLEDAMNIRTPMKIIYGRLDPIVVTRNLHVLVKSNTNTTLTTVLAGHEIKGSYVDTVVKTIIKTTEANATSNKIYLL
jgi:pimeloyl-ACP methyl ester carboxylesterase